MKKINNKLTRGGGLHYLAILPKKGGKYLI
jgi:hypothetical protein